MIRLGFLKLGNIGTAPMLELLLDERAEREDIEVRVASTGANMTAERAEGAAMALLDFKPHIVFITSPNAATPGPAKAREVMNSHGIPVIVISDGPRKLVDDLAKQGMGVIIVEADSMIGARREYLDPVEMSIYNADVIKVLAITGAYSVIFKIVDDIISQLKEGKSFKMPSLVVDAFAATNAAGFANPYARAKAFAAFELAKRVSSLTTDACFRVKEWEIYTAICASAHEMMRMAAKLSDEAREIEKEGDQVLRTPHARDGSLMIKRRLMEKPKKE